MFDYGTGNAFDYTIFVGPNYAVSLVASNYMVAFHCKHPCDLNAT